MRWALWVVLTACSSSNQETSTPADAAVDTTQDAATDTATLPARSFRLGFTPFPSDVTSDAVTLAYQHLDNDGDLYAFHQLAGVPWLEATKPFEQWGKNIRETFAFEKSKVKAGHAVYLGLTPLDDGRARLADQWGDSEHMPLAAPWDTYAFDAPEVKAAYLAFCEASIARYAPDYLAIGIEVNLLKKNAPTKWAAYATLNRETYQALKKTHPTLPIFVTVTAVDILPGWTDANAKDQADALADVMPYSDYLALSFYPYMSAYLTNDIPADTFTQLEKIAGAKPIAIAESGYPAEHFEIPAYKLVFDGTEAKQDAWIEKLFAAAEKYRFVVNFVPRDYDALWEKTGKTDLALIWRDTGLIAGDGKQRASFARWKAALARPYR
jgi:hypothetical protein